MKLWLLEANAKEVDWDCSAGFVVRAETAHKARELASEKAGDEGKEVWLDAARSMCGRIQEEGPPCILLHDFNAG